MTGTMASASKVFETAISVTEARSRRARSQAVAMSRSTAANASDEGGIVTADISYAMALIRVKPTCDMASIRVTGFEIIPPAALRHPRVDVTLRISGFFRDAFPEQIALFDRAVRAVGALEEDDADNPISARMHVEAAALAAKGAPEEDAAKQAGVPLLPEEFRGLW